LKQESKPYFLKKRSKKLFQQGPSPLSTSTVPVERSKSPYNKSFLLLFFKKEGLAFLLAVALRRAGFSSRDSTIVSALGALTSLTQVLPSSTSRQEVAMTAKTSISLTDEQEAYARSLVESGQYPSLSAVLQRGLDMLRRESEMRDAELEALRSLIDQRRLGAFVDIDVGEAETRAMLTRKRNARATL
jgi:antitoxin ParD1/3/4